MAQLIVRKLEKEVVQKLKERAAKYGVSMEEEHRRILRETLLKRRKPKMSFKELLLTVPDFGNPDSLRRKDKPRDIDLTDRMAFVLDTNVISELRKGASRCNANVWRWYDATPLEEIYLSVIVLGEMRYGIEKKKKRDPETGRIFERWLKEVMLVHRERILPISSEICDVWGRMAARANVSTSDGLIAATATYHGLTVATRNSADFQPCGVDYFNPFEG